MTQFGDSFLRLAGTLGKKRDQMIDQAVTLESTRLATEWQQSADNHLLESEVTGTNSRTFYDDETNWYKENLEQFSSQIESDEVRNNFTKFALKHQSQYGEKAFATQIKKIGQEDLAKVETSASQYTGSIMATTNSVDLDRNFDLYKDKMQADIDHAIPSLQPAFKKQYAGAAKSYIDKKLNLLTMLKASNKITKEDYLTELDIIQQSVSGDSFIKGVLSPTELRSYGNTIANAKVKGLEKAAKVAATEITNNFGAYMKAVQDGHGERNIAFENQISNLAESGNVSMAQKQKEINILLDDTEAFRNAEHTMDLETMNSELERVTDLVEGGSLFGVDYAIRLKQKTLMENRRAKALDLRNTNFREFAKNHPDVKFAESQAEILGEKEPLIKTLVELAVDQGIDSRNVEFLDKEEMLLTLSEVNQADESMELEGLFTKLKQDYSTVINEDGTPAYRNAVSQILQGAAEMNLPTGKILLFNYEGTPQFNALFEAQKIKLSDATSIMGDQKAFSSLKKKVNKEIKKYLEPIQAARPVNAAGIIKAFRDFAHKTALYAYQSPDVSDNRDDIAKFVTKHMFENQYEVYNTSDVHVLYPKEGGNWGEVKKRLRDPAIGAKILDYYLDKTGASLSMVGDIQDKIVEASTNADVLESVKGELTREALLDGIQVMQSESGNGVTLYFRSRVMRDMMPLVLKDAGKVGISFDELTEIPRSNVEDSYSNFGLVR